MDPMVNPTGSVRRNGLTVFAVVRADGLSATGADNTGSAKTDDCRGKDVCICLVGCGGGFSHLKSEVQEIRPA